MRYAHILSRFTGTPWLITESALSSIASLLESRIHAAPSPAPSAEPSEVPEPESLQVKSTVAVVPVHGILGKHLSMMETMCGGCDFDAVTAMVATAAADPSVSAIVLALNSPGGTATGCAEAYARLGEIRQHAGKPLYAFTDARACSAAYYLAAACDAVFCTSSSEIGSIGTILSIEDRSGQLAAAGVRRFTFKSASMKDIGSPWRAPTPEESTELQQRVDYLGGMFRRDVEAGRSEIAPEVFEKGLTYFGEQAVAVGLADAVVANLESLIVLLHEAHGAGIVASAVAPSAASPARQAAAPRAAAALPPPAAAPAPAADPLAAIKDHLTFNITLPSFSVAAPHVNVAAPPVNVHVDSRLEKDSIAVHQSQTSGGAKKIISDAEGRPIGLAPADPTAAAN
jgi:signal peptide peptidase SppA